MQILESIQNNFGKNIENVESFTKKDSQKMKGIAILLLLFHHLFYKKNFWGGNNIGISFFTTGRIVHIAIFSKICVGMFVFITGYGLAKSLMKIEKTGVAKWYNTRLKKNILMCAYPITLSLIITELIDHRASEFYFSGGVAKGIVRLISTYLCLDNVFNQRLFVGAWWYLSAIIIFVIVVPMIFYMVKCIGSEFALLMVVIVPRVLKIDDLGGGNNPLSYLFVLTLGVIFAYQNVFAYVQNRRKNLLQNICLFLGLSVLLVGCYYIYLDLYETTWFEVYWGLIPVVAIVFSYQYVISIPLLSTVLNIFGKYSLYIFLTHAFIRAIYFKEFIYGMDNFVYMFFTCTGLSLLLALAIANSKKMFVYIAKRIMKK